MIANDYFPNNNIGRRATTTITTVARLKSKQAEEKEEEEVTLNPHKKECKQTQNFGIYQQNQNCLHHSLHTQRLEPTVHMYM